MLNSIHEDVTSRRTQARLGLGVTDRGCEKELVVGFDQDHLRRGRELKTSCEVGSRGDAMCPNECREQWHLVLLFLSFVFFLCWGGEGSFRF